MLGARRDLSNAQSRDRSVIGITSACGAGVRFVAFLNDLALPNAMLPCCGSANETELVDSMLWLVLAQVHKGNASADVRPEPVREAMGA
jgi:hypothetical protein